MFVEWFPSEPRSAILGFSLLSLLLISLQAFSTRPVPENKGFPVANRSFAQEPPILALLRWAVKARRILDDAYKRFGDRVYKVSRGDLDLVVVPTKFIPELNLLPESIISSRAAHSYNLVGYLNGIDIVTKTSLHVKTVQHKLMPALPRLLDGMRSRIDQAINKAFPYDSHQWIIIEPMDKLLHCVSRATSFVAVGTPMCDDPEYIRLTSEHAKHVFTTTIILRIVPSFLQSSVVWLLPSKWRLEHSFRGMADFVVPEAKRRAANPYAAPATDMLFWMMEKADGQESDPKFLTLLQAVLAAGGTHTTAILTFNTLCDLATHPHFQQEIREEIKMMHKETKGVWDHAAFNSLLKLDSAMKETMRITPASLTAYSRFMVRDHTLSNGVTLQKGQMICVSSCSRQRDPAVFPEPDSYNALRAYNENLKNHVNKPFKSVDSDGLRWGAGRWACPGRFLASLEAKIILVKLISKFDFKLRDGHARPPSITAHEFIFANERAQLIIRRRPDTLEVAY